MTGDLLLMGATVRLPLVRRPAGSALLIRNGRVVAVGTDRKVSGEARPGTRTEHVAGRCVLPAFADAHVHLSGLGALLEEVDLTGAETLKAALDRIAEEARRLKPGQWLRGRGWDRNRWSDGQPTRELLDRIAPENPVALSSHDGHSLWVNSLTLRLAGIDRESTSPPGGTIWRDAGGEPTGILSDAAVAPVRRLMPRPSDTELKDALQQAARHVLRFGVAAVRNCEGLRIHRLLQELAQAGDFPIRVASSVRPDEIEEAADLVARQSPQDRVLIDNVKCFVDGALGSQTALMLEPYEDPALGVGLEVTPPEVLREQVMRAARAGLAVALHAIGDRAVRQALDAIEEAGRFDLANSVEHAQLIHPDDLPRFARLGVTASVQPSHLLTDIPISERHWGRRCRHAFPLGSLLRSGARVRFGSDCPVEPADPRRNLFAATVRRTPAGYPEGGWYPEERVSVPTGLTCHTEPAQPGARADLVVLARDPLGEPPEHILDNDILMTIVEGEVAYRAEG